MDKTFQINSVTFCPTCGSEVSVANGDGDSHYYVPKYEYEMFFKSEPDDFCKIDGWLPVETSMIRNQDKIESYIERGILRKIKSK